MAGSLLDQRIDIPLDAERHRLAAQQALQLRRHALQNLRRRLRHAGRRALLLVADKVRRGVIQEGLEDTDVKAEDDGTGPVVCKECLAKEKRAAIFCTPQCASKNIGPHRAATHEAKDEEPSDALEYLSPLQEVVEDTFKEINPGLTYTWS